MLVNLNYSIALIIFVFSLYSLIANQNLIKKLFSLAIFQAAILLFYISIAKVQGGKIPLLNCLNYKNCPNTYTNPLPHVLMLTAIVVGVATLAVGVALVVRIKENLNSIEENEIINKLQQSKEIKK